VIKHNFDQTPKLLETFDQLIRSSEIRSSDHFPMLSNQLIQIFKLHVVLFKLDIKQAKKQTVLLHRERKSYQSI
jgi:hypothetical protein